MNNLIYKGAINPLSFGNVSYNILRELYRKGMTVAFFPFGENLNFESFDKIDPDFQQWIVSMSHNRYHLIDKDYHTLSQWHINSSENRISRYQTLFTFHETDQATEIEKRIVSLQDKCIFGSSHSRDVFKSAGCENVHSVNLGFDEDFQALDQKHLEGKLHFGLMGKFEKRKNTAQILKNWAKTYGNNPDYQLSCCVNNSFLKAEHLNQFIAQALEGQAYANINFLPHLKTNSEVNDFLNSIDIDLSGLSGAEGWNIPAFNSTALGKWSIVLNCTSHKDWANSSNSILVEPDGQESIHDGIFFKPETPFNQGNMSVVSDSKMVESFKLAESKSNKLNKNGLKLKEEFTYEKTVNQILKIIENEK